MDYRQFLQNESEEFRLPYFEGQKVCDDSRTWRIRDQIDPGWYRFTASGRFLTPQERIEPELDAWQQHGLKELHGYIALGQFIGNERQERLFGLSEDEDLPRFSPISALEWFDGNLHFTHIEFEEDAEIAVRKAFEDEQSIDNIKAVTPALANAFLLESTQRELSQEALRRREEEARQRQMEAESHEQRIQLADQQITLEGRIALALSHTGARLVDWRRSGNNQLTVRYQVGSQRFECVIDSNTLRIIDSGICLEGADAELNLASLPSAVQEAIESGQLYVF